MKQYREENKELKGNSTERIIEDEKEIVQRGKQRIKRKQYIKEENRELKVKNPVIYVQIKDNKRVFASLLFSIEWPAVKETGELC